MKLLLLAINAKYIHTNPALYALRQYARDYAEHIVLREYTINHEPDAILKGIYEVHPQVLCVSCYIWNIRMVREIIADYRKIDPSVVIYLGGPEVSYDARDFLLTNPAADGILVGEGEATFRELVEYHLMQEAGQRTQECRAVQQAPAGMSREDIRGLVFRREDGTICENELRELLDFAALPFPYADMKALGAFEHKIIYYETSRGCPFSCCYCLSSVEKRVRFRALELVRQELQIFLDNRVAQVKFVDRTFNCNEQHALAIWQYIKEHDNGVTNFHFEIAADLLTQREMELLRTMRPGLVQLEIGIQSTNPQTIEAIHRRMDLDKVRAAVAAVREGRNIHQHLDLIAGLPYEDYTSFARSFNEVYAMRPDQLQLGFLKVLKGSAMHEMTAEHEIQYKEEPPYEVLSTKYLPYAEVLRLKEVEELTEVYYNSGQFLCSLPFLERYFASPFAMYEALAAYYRSNGLFEVKHSRLARYESLYRFAEECANGTAGHEVWMSEDGRRLDETACRVLAELLMFDFCSREKPKSRPFFAESQDAYREQWRQYRRSYSEGMQDVSGQLAMEHFYYDLQKASETGEIEEKEGFVIFDYREREPLHGICRISRKEA